MQSLPDKIFSDGGSIYESSQARRCRPAVLRNVGTGSGENTFAKPPKFWWPDRIDLTPLRQHAPESNPYGPGFNYAEAFAQVDLSALKADIRAT